MPFSRQSFKRKFLNEFHGHFKSNSWFFGNFSSFNNQSSEFCLNPCFVRLIFPEKSNWKSWYHLPKKTKQKRICKDLKIIIRFCFLFELENRDSHSFQAKLQNQISISKLLYSAVSFHEFLFLLENNYEKYPLFEKSIFH